MEINNITIPAHGSWTFQYRVYVMTPAQFVTAGVPENQINGKQISNQGSISAAFLAQPIRTDDPNTTTAGDPTLLDVEYRVTVTATKSGIPSSGTVKPGDALTYTINVRNSGNRAATVTITDDMPLNTTYGSHACPPGVTCTFTPPPAGAHQRGQLTVANMEVPKSNGSISLRLGLTVSSDAQNQAQVKNCAAVAVAEDSGQNSTVCSTVVTVDSVPVFTSSTKSVLDLNGAEIRPNDILRYTVTVKNSGNRPATNVVITDVLNSLLTFVSASNGGSYNATNRTITWNLSTLAQGASVALTFDARIDPLAVTGDVVTNLATIDSTETAPVNTNRVSSTIAAPPPDLDARTEKRVRDMNGGDLEPGDTVEYTIVVRNTGVGVAQEVVVDDPIEVNHLEDIRPSQGGIFANNTITWNRTTTNELAAIMPGGEVTLTFTAKVKLGLANGTVISDQAKVTTPSLSGQIILTDANLTSPGNQPTTLTVKSEANLSNTLKAVQDLNGGSYKPGDTVKYTITINNTGNGAARNVTVTDPVSSAHFDEIQPGEGGVFSGGTITWTIAQVVPGEPTLLTFTARIKSDLQPPAGTDYVDISNQGTVNSADISAPVPTDNPATGTADDPTVFRVNFAADLTTSTKTVENVTPGKTAYDPGDQVRYTLVITNNGNMPARSVVVTDTVATAYLESVVVGQGGSYNPGSSLITWNKNTTSALEELAAGAAVTLSFTARLKSVIEPPAGQSDITVSNQGRITYQDLAGGPVLTDDPSTTAVDDDPTNFTVTPKPDFNTSLKTADKIKVRPGEILNYTITVKNRGARTANNVVVTDDSIPVSAPTRYFTNITPLDGGVYSAGTVIWNIGTLAPGAEKTVRFSAEVVKPLDDGIRLENQAKITSTEVTTPVLTDGDPSTADIDEKTLVTVVANVDLTDATKTVANESGQAVTTADPGQALDYTITFSNKGDASAKRVEITDLVDTAHLEIISYPGGQLQGSTIKWDSTRVAALAEVKPGDRVALTFKVRVRNPMNEPNTLIYNQGQLRYRLLDGSLSDPVDTDANLATPAREKTLFTVRASADLNGTTKTVTDANGQAVQQVTPGQTLLYTIKVVNSGNMIADDVEVTDALPLYLTGVQPQDGGSLAGGTLTWNKGGNNALARLAPGESNAVTLRFRATVTTPAPNGFNIDNQATIASPDIGTSVRSDDPTTSAVDDATRVTVVSAPDLKKSTKTVDDPNGAPVRPGDALNYTITVRNDGTDTALVTRVTDVIDAGLTNVVPANNGSYDAQSRTITWNVGQSLDPGAQPIELKFSAQVVRPLDHGTVISNQGQIAATHAGQPMTTILTDADTSTPNVADKTVVTVVSAPDFTRFEKKVADTNGGLVLPGDSLTYTLTLTNTGDMTAQSVVVTDSVETANLENVQPGQGGVYANGVITWNVGTAGLQTPLTFTFTARIKSSVPNGATISNQAKVVSRLLPQGVLSDADLGTPDREPTKLVVGFPEFSTSTKSVRDVNGGDVTPDDTLSYTIVVKNTGSFEATGVVVTDLIDINLVNVQPAGIYNAATRTITWNKDNAPELARVAPNQNVTLSFTAKVRLPLDNGTQLKNKAKIKSAEYPQEFETNEIVSTVVSAPDFSAATKVVADDNGDPVAPGDTLTYTLKFKNEGNSDAHGVLVTDQLDPLLEVILPVPGGGTVSNNVITWSLGDVTVGETKSLTFQAKVASSAQNNQIIPNQGRITYTGGGPVLTDDPNTYQVDDPTKVKVVAAPKFDTSTKTATDANGGENFKPNEEVIFTLTLKNSGTQNAEGTKLMDPLPYGLVYIPGSTTMNGQPVPDASGGASPLLTGISINATASPVGQIPIGREVVVSFKARILASVAKGSPLTNRAHVFNTQEPAAEFYPEVTFVVGGGPNLLMTSKIVALVVDQQRPNVIDRGDTLEYTISIPNYGNQDAANVVFKDAIPERSTYLAGSLTLNGQPLSDAADGDAGEFVSGSGQGEVAVRVGTLARRGQAGDRATITFRVLADGNDGESISNQGRVKADGLVEEPTDNDGDESNGDNPTVSVIGVAPKLTAEKKAQDINGGTVQAGDEIRFEITLNNYGVEAANVVSIIDAIPARTTYVQGSLESRSGGTATFEAPPAGTHGRGQVKVEGLTVQPQEQISISFKVKIDGDVRDGQALENVGRVQGGNVAAFNTNTVRLLIGSGLGNTRIRGFIFQDKGVDNKQYDVGVDYPLSDFQILIFKEGEERGDPVRGDISSSDGSYNLNDLAPGKYVLKYLTDKGVVFGSISLGKLAEGDLREQNILVDPSGIIYNSRNANPIENAKVYIYFDESNTFKPGELVPDDPQYVKETQQGQSTDSRGMYQFNLATGHKYRIKVEYPDSQAYQYPSVLVPPTAGFASVQPPENEVVPNERPNISGRTTYYLRFDLPTAADEVKNNHLPLDPITSLLRLSKRSNKREVVVGEVITYTVQVQNFSSKDFLANSSNGGINIQDKLPKGFRYVKGSARAKRLIMTNGRQQEALLVNGSTDPSRGTSGVLLRFGKYDLRAGDTVILRYQTVVGSSVRVGEYWNTAVTLNNDGSKTLSEEDRVMVRVKYDPIFDQGLLLGKVFCDQNGNGWQDPGDEGVAGARIYMDTGYYAVTDSTGKYHLKDINPGLHMVKIDTQSLPPESKLTTDERRIIYFTRGLPAKVDFGVRCKFTRVGIQKLTLKKVKGKKELPLKYLIQGNVNSLDLFINRRAAPLWAVDLKVWQRDVKPGPGNLNASAYLPTDKARKGLKAPLLFFPKVHLRSAIAEESGQKTLKAPADSLKKVLGRKVRPADSIKPVALKKPARTENEVASEMYMARMAFDAAHKSAEALVAKMEMSERQVQEARAAMAMAKASKNQMVMETAGKVLNKAKRIHNENLLLLKQAKLAESKAQADLAAALKVAQEMLSKRKGKAAATKGKGKAAAAKSKSPAVAKPYSPAPLKIWSLVIRGEDGKVLWERMGRGKPPAKIEWTGVDRDGRHLQLGARYLAQFTVGDARMGYGVSAPQVFGVAHGKHLHQKTPPIIKLVKGRLFYRRIRLRRNLRRKLEDMALLLKNNPKFSLAIGVHTDDQGAKLDRLLKTREQAAIVRQYLISQHGIDAKRLAVTGFGDAHPLIPNINRRTRAMNRRIEFTFLKPEIYVFKPAPVPSLPPQPQSVLVDGKRIKVNVQGGFKHQVKRKLAGTLLIQMVQKDGRKVVYQFGKPDMQRRLPSRVGVQGDLRGRWVRMGKQEVPLTRLDLDCRAQSPRIILHEGGSPSPIVFKPSVTGKFVRWWVEVLDARRRPVTRIYGKGPEVDKVVKWTFRKEKGKTTLRPGYYIYRLVILEKSGNQWKSPERWLEVAKPQLRYSAKVVYKKKLLSRRLFKTKTTRGTGRLRWLLRREARKMKRALRKNRKLVFSIEAHTDSDGAPERNLKLTQQQAEWVKRYLIYLKIPGANIMALGRGEKEPLVVNIGRRNKAKNRRIVLSQLTRKPLPKVKKGQPPALKRGELVLLNGDRLTVDSTGRFHKQLLMTGEDSVILDIRNRSGAQGLIVIGRSWDLPGQINRPPENRPGTPPTMKPVPKGKPNASMMMMRIPAGKGKAEEGNPVTKRLAGKKPPPAKAVKKAATVTNKPAVTVKPPAKAVKKSTTALRKAPAPAGKPKAATRTKAPAAGKPDRLSAKEKSYTYSRFGEKELELALSRKARKPQSSVKAAQLTVKLPPKGSVIRSDSLTISGQTHRDNKITVNGIKAQVLRDGGFSVQVKLRPGKQYITIVSSDKEGNKGRIKWPIEVSRFSLFLLAMAEGALGQAGVKLDGMDKTTSTLVKDRMFLHGRTVAYLKMRIQGKYLFKNIRITAHFDTAKRREMESFFAQMVDPEKYYPVYGDSSKEVRDVNARDKVYVMIEADRSKLQIGNFKTDIKGLDLLKYNRTYYGVNLDFRKVLAKKFDTQLKVFVSNDADHLVHGHNELRATGGSIYYLKERELVAGSERVRIVIRDKDTGMELYSVAKARDVDYTIRYREGQILFKSPVSSVVDASFLINNNLGTIRDGHPVYVVVDFEYQSTSKVGGTSWGIHAREKIAKFITLGGGYIQEGRSGSGPDYRLWGTDLKLEYRGAYVKAEFARSQAVDAKNFVSDDGGLTFTQLGNGSREARGNAYKFELGGEVGKLLKKKRDILHFRAYYQNQDAGFFSNGKMLDQGSQKFGLTLKWKITKADTLTVRHDGILSEMFERGDLTKAPRRGNRQITTLQYKHTHKRWSLTGEYTHSMYSQFGGSATLPRTGVILGDALAAGFTYKLSKRVSLLGKQETFIRGNPTEIRKWGDRLVTTLGASFKLMKDLDLTVSESLRWSGENATTIALKSKLSKTISIYAKERLTQRDGRFTTTTVLGGENRITKNSRAYAEYQLESGILGRRNQAVLGAKHRFKLPKGINLTLGYERAQTFGNAAGGSRSRDVGHVGLNFLAKEYVKAQALYELRYDNGDESTGGHDKVQFTTTNGVNWKWTKDLTFMTRFNYSLTKNLTLALTEARHLALSAGIAFRPVQYNWIAVLLKYTRYVTQRPLNLLEGRFEQQDMDVVTLMPIFNLPYGFQIVEKFAWRRARERYGDLQPATSDTLLWINRLNYHLTNYIDASIEYRLLKNSLASDIEHGFLVEASYILKKHVRFSVGYNFTRFSDDEFAKSNENSSGFYFRITGMY